MTFLSTALSNQRENTVSYGVSNATLEIGNGTINGQIYIQIGTVTQGYRRNIWLWDDNNSKWECLPLTAIQGTGDPTGTVTPDCIGQNFYASDTSNLYIATGATINDWELTN